MPENIEKQKVVVVGAGPVGALAALYAASRGDHVEIYELRSGTSKVFLYLPFTLSGESHNCILCVSWSHFTHTAGHSPFSPYYVIVPLSRSHAGAAESYFFCRALKHIIIREFGDEANLFCFSSCPAAS